MGEPILQVNGLEKSYYAGLLARRRTFHLEAHFSVAAPEIIGVMPTVPARRRFSS